MFLSPQKKQLPLPDADSPNRHHVQCLRSYSTSQLRKPASNYTVGFMIHFHRVTPKTHAHVRYICVCSGLDHVRSHQIPCLPCWCTPAVSIPMLIPIQRVNTVQPPESLFFTYSTNVLFLTESNVQAHKRKQSAGIGLVCLKTGYCQTVSTPKSTRYHVPYQMAVGLQLYFQTHPNITLLVSVGLLLVSYFLPIPASQEVPGKTAWFLNPIDHDFI